MRRSFPALAALLGAAALSLAEGPSKGSPSDQVICVACGDYTFDRKDATPATYEGKKISLCSINELAMIKRDPDKYVWAADPVSGSRVNKIHTEFTADRRVKVRKKDGKIEVWPRRFFFESARTRDAFLKTPEMFVKEPYSG